jgi:hypothetical protein
VRCASVVTIASTVSKDAASVPRRFRSATICATSRRSSGGSSRATRDNITTSAKAKLSGYTS